MARSKRYGAKGCVLVGDPAYYRRFGFENDPALNLEAVPPEFFMRLVLEGEAPKGVVTFHEGFGAS